MLLSLCLGGTRVEGTFSLNGLWRLKLASSGMEFPLLLAAIQKQSFITNYKYICIVNDIKPLKRCPKNNFQSGSCKLGFTNNSLEDDLIEFA